jgi:hypothetical protein
MVVKNLLARIHVPKVDEVQRLRWGRCCHDESCGLEASTLVGSATGYGVLAACPKDSPAEPASAERLAGRNPIMAARSAKVTHNLRRVRAIPSCRINGVSGQRADCSLASPLRLRFYRRAAVYRRAVESEAASDWRSGVGSTWFGCLYILTWKERD